MGGLLKVRMGSLLKVFLQGLFAAFVSWLALDSIDAYAKRRILDSFPLGPLPVALEPKVITYGSLLWRGMSGMGDWIAWLQMPRVWSRPRLLPLYSFLPEYDFIVIGSGAGGSTAAARLAERLPAADILLLEAGSYGTEGLLSTEMLPAASLMNQGSSVDWQHRTVPQKHGLYGMRDKVSLWPMGKTLGGSTAVNYMIVHHGDAADYNLWATCLQDETWNSTNMYKVFQSLEKPVGNIPVHTQYDHSPFAEYLMAAASEAGLELVKDYNAFTAAVNDSVVSENEEASNKRRRSLGTASPLQLNKEQGRRVTFFRAMVEPLIKRNYWESRAAEDRNSGTGRLHVVPYAYVTNLQWERETNSSAEVRVTGVEFVIAPDWYKRRVQGRLDKLTAQMLPIRKEVVLGGGAVGSAHLLLNSRIGPEKELRDIFGPEADILDVPGVGKNLEDHAYSPLLLSLHEKHRHRVLSPRNAQRLTNLWGLLNGMGVLTSPGANSQLMLPHFDTLTEKKLPPFCHGLGKDDSSTSTAARAEALLKDAPDIQVILYDGVPEPAQLLTHMNVELTSIFQFGQLDRLGLTEKLVKKIRADPSDLVSALASASWNTPLVLMLPIILHPNSRGTVTLRSPDPFSPPLIDPHYLEDQRDLELMLEGQRLVEHIANHSNTWKTFVHSLLSGTCSSLDDLSEETAAVNSTNWSRTLEHELPDDVREACRNAQDYETRAKHFASRLVMTLYHPAGTCRMGRADDPLACTDSNLLVRHTRNLRIADAAAMPSLPSGNTALPTAAIGRRAADAIIAKWTS